MTVSQSVVVGRNEITPYKRRVCDFRRAFNGYFGKVDYFETFVEITFAFFSRGFIVLKNVKSVIIFIFGINTVTRKPAAETV